METGGKSLRSWQPHCTYYCTPCTRNLKLQSSDLASPSVLARIVCLQPMAMVLRNTDFVQLPRDHHHVHCHLLLALAGYTWKQGC